MGGIKERYGKCCDRLFSESIFSIEPNERDIDVLLQSIDQHMTEEDNQSLAKPFSPIEVTKGLSTKSSLKSHGPDSYPILFYNKFWYILDNYAISCAIAFLNSYSIPESLNHTYIVLIPISKSPIKRRSFAQQVCVIRSINWGKNDC